MANDASLNRIRLELARTTDFPTGSAWHGYEFIAPLTADGHVDASAWSRTKELCHVRRFWGDGPEEHGQLVHAGEDWCFEYPASHWVGKESFFKLDRHRFTPGGYVAITEPNGEQHPFRVVAMTPTLLAD